MAFENISRIYFVALIVLLASSLMPVGVQAVTLDEYADTLATDVKSKVTGAKYLNDKLNVVAVLKGFVGVLTKLGGTDVTKSFLSVTNFGTSKAMITQTTSDKGGVVEVTNGVLNWFEGAVGEGGTSATDLQTQGKANTVISDAFTAVYDPKFTGTQMPDLHKDLVAMHTTYTPPTGEFEEGSSKFSISFAATKVGLKGQGADTLKISLQEVSGGTSSPGGGGGHTREGGGGGGTRDSSYTGSSTTSSASEFGAPCSVVASSICISLIANIVA